MAKRIFKQYMPSPEKIRDLQIFRLFGDVLLEPNLWHINRRSVSKAFIIGLFFCCIPMPFQMVASAIFALWLNCNLPIAVALVWISNPLTMPPMFYFNYLVGAYLLDLHIQKFEFQLSWSWLSSVLYDIGIPLYFGSLVVGIFFAVLGYTFIQFFWRRKVVADWRKRQRERAQKKL